MNFLGSFQRIPEKNQKVHHETPPVHPVYLLIILRRPYNQIIKPVAIQISYLQTVPQTGSHNKPLLTLRLKQIPSLNNMTLFQLVIKIFPQEKQATRVVLIRRSSNNNSRFVAINKRKIIRNFQRKAGVTCLRRMYHFVAHFETTSLVIF